MNVLTIVFICSMVTSMALSQQYGCSIVTWVSRISQCGVMGLTRESIFLCRVRPKVGSYINGSFRNWTALISLLVIISFPSLESDVPIYNPTIGSTSMLCIYGIWKFVRCPICQCWTSWTVVSKIYHKAFLFICCLIFKLMFDLS